MNPGLTSLNYSSLLTSLSIATDCQCTLPEGMKNCKNLPAEMKIDYIRLYQVPLPSLALSSPSLMVHLICDHRIWMILSTLLDAHQRPILPRNIFKISLVITELNSVKIDLFTHISTERYADWTPRQPSNQTKEFGIFLMIAVVSLSFFAPSFSPSHMTLLFPDGDLDHHLCLILFQYLLSRQIFCRHNFFSSSFSLFITKRFSFQWKLQCDVTPPS
jgi:hypothetical protein